MPYREGCSSACSSFDNRHAECSGIGSLDQDGSQLLCQCHCHRKERTVKCRTCGGSGKITERYHEGVKR